MAADPSGNLYIIESGPSYRIRRIDTNGILITLFTGPAGMNSPQFLALQGNQLVAYAGLTQVARFSTTGIAGPSAGATPQPTPDGTPARNAWFNHLSSMAVNRAGDLYLAEQDFCLIRKVGADGILRTVAGTGVCAAASFQHPSTTQDLAPPAKIFADSQGNVYMVDLSANAYLITPDGKVAVNTTPNASQIVAIDAKDRLYIQTGGLVRLSPNGTQVTVLNLPAPPPGVVNLTRITGFGVDPAAPSTSPDPSSHPTIPLPTNRCSA